MSNEPKTEIAELRDAIDLLLAMTADIKTLLERTEKISLIADFVDLQTELQKRMAGIVQKQKGG